MLGVMRRDWLLTGLSAVAVVMVFLAVDKAIDFQADAAPTQVSALD